MKRLTLLFALAASGPVAAQDAVRTLDLSNGRQFDQLFLRFGHHSGRTVAPERGGVRFQLPPLKPEAMAGYYSSFSLVGDFEVSFDLDLVAVSTPSGGYGPGVGATIDAEGEDGSICLVRGLSPTASPQFALVRMTPNSDGTPKYETETFPATGTRARLVLRREKDEVVVFAGDKPGGAVRELKRIPFTERRVRYLRLHASNGGSQSAITARLTNVQVRADEIVGGLTQTELAAARSYWWWWMPVAGVAFGAALVVRRHRRVEE